MRADKASKHQQRNHILPGSRDAEGDKVRNANCGGVQSELLSGGAGEELSPPPLPVVTHLPVKPAAVDSAGPWHTTQSLSAGNLTRLKSPADIILTARITRPPLIGQSLQEAFWVQVVGLLW